MEFQKIFGRAFRYPLNLKIYIILFVFSLFMTLPPMMYSASYAQSGQFQSLQEMINFFKMMIPFWIISFFVGNLVAAFFFDNASRYYPGMKYGNLADSFETAKKRYIPLLGTQILFFVVIGIVFAAFAAGPLMLALLGAPILIILVVGIALGIIAAAVTAFFLFLCPFACVIDGLGPFDSLRKSFNLVKVNKANTFVFWIILLVAVFIIGLVGSMPSTIYSAMTGYSVMSAGGVIALLIQILFSTYAGLFSYSANVNFYTTLKSGTKIPGTRAGAKPRAKAKPKTKKKPARKTGKTKKAKKPARKRKK